MSGGRRRLETLATLTGVLATIALGLAAGAMLAEAGVLVPWWRFLPPEAFLIWYAENASRLLGFYGPLEVIATALALGAAALAGHHRGGGPGFVIAAVLAFAILLMFPLYFQRVNASFADGSVGADGVSAALAQWAGWHWARTAIGIVAFVAALLGARADVGGASMRSPAGDPTRHRALAELEVGLRALATAPKDVGRLALIVRRRADGIRETPERVRLTLEEGVPGDDWSRRPPRDPEAQLAVMQHAVAELLANGQPITVFGDNLFVDLDLSTGNLPTGTRLRVGDAVVQVTPKPHNGCKKFLARFGGDGLRLVQAAETRHLNLRGIYWRVVEPGCVHVGATITVLARPSAPVR